MTENLLRFEYMKNFPHSACRGSFFMTNPLAFGENLADLNIETGKFSELSIKNPIALVGIRPKGLASLFEVYYTLLFRPKFGLGVVRSLVEEGPCHELPGPEEA
ncbi:MAG: hypothetical protein GXO27_02615 [Chlorobi bacterium]|nr:hypothetical protein [Chlorobiota bacterium]